MSSQPFSIANLGLTVPNQIMAQGPYTSGGSSFGFGERHEPLDAVVDPRYGQKGGINGQPKRLFNTNPGVGDYNLAKDGRANSNPKYV